MSDEHTSPIKTPKQLAIVLALAFLVPITLFLLLSQLVTLFITPVLYLWFDQLGVRRPVPAVTANTEACVE